MVLMTASTPFDEQATYQRHTRGSLRTGRVGSPDVSAIFRTRCGNSRDRVSHVPSQCAGSFDFLHVEASARMASRLPTNRCVSECGLIQTWESHVETLLVNPELLRTIEGEFAEMPGMRLTEAQ